MTSKGYSMLLASATAALLALSTPSWASTQEPGLQHQIDELILQHPGGVQTGWNEITWGQGEVVMNLAQGRAGDSLTSSCAAGRFCAFDGANYSGNKITFSTCTSSHSVSPLPRPVRSMYNARSSGTIRAYAGSTLLASASAGSGSNVTGTTSHISCS